MGRRFREHGVMLFLDKELYTAFIKLQADKGLGRSFAGLLPFVEGLYSMGYIDEQVYEKHTQKYSKPLVQQKPLQHFLDKEDKQLNKALGMVAEQWEEHRKPEWRQKWIIIARQHPKLPNSKLVLEKEVGPINAEAKG